MINKSCKQTYQEVKNAHHYLAYNIVICTALTKENSDEMSIISIRMSIINILIATVAVTLMEKLPSTAREFLTAIPSW